MNLEPVPYVDKELNPPLVKVVHGSFGASKDIGSFFLQQVFKVFS